MVINVECSLGSAAWSDADIERPAILMQRAEASGLKKCASGIFGR